jgi:hypothetical protein
VTARSATRFRRSRRIAGPPTAVFRDFDVADPDQTTSYAELVEVGPNRLLLAYDRVPCGWKPVPTDSSERNRMYVLEVDVERV